MLRAFSGTADWHPRGVPAVTGFNRYGLPLFRGFIIHPRDGADQSGPTVQIRCPHPL